jgi:hypothetical protein
MKKIFTLLVAVGFITAINAQSGSKDRDNRDNRDQQTDQRGNNRDDVINDGRYDNDDRYDNNTGSYNRNIRMQIAQINRKYDIRIDRVRDNRFIRRSEKMRMIRSLEEQRKQEIRMAYARSNKRGQPDRGHDSNHRY